MVDVLLAQLSTRRSTGVVAKKTAGSSDPAVQNSESRNLAQPAFATGASAAFFFSIWRFSSSARGESRSAFCLSRKASRPPLWSTLFSALVETRRRTLRPSTSEMKVTLHRFGRNRRLVLIFEWLTLWPTSGPLAVSSQRRDIVQNPLPSPSLRHFAGAGVQNHVRFGNRGRIGEGWRPVKVLGRPARARQGPDSRRFRKA